DRPVLVFSLEMPASQLVIRMLSSMGRIDQTRMRSGRLEPEDFNRLGGAAARLKDRPLFIDDTPGLNPMELRNRVRRLVRERRDQFKARMPEAAAEDLTDLPGTEDHRPGVSLPSCGAVAAKSECRAAPQQASDQFRSAGIRSHRTGCGRHRLHLS